KLAELPEVKGFVRDMPEENEEAGGDHKHEKDPHLWLGLGTANNKDVSKPDGPAQALVFAIAKELSQVDPDGAKTYEENAEKYAARLTELRDEYQKELKKAKDTKVLPTHDALQYFGKSFD